MKKPEDCTVLFIEDCEEDVFFIRRAITKLGFRGQVRDVATFELALAYLQGEPPFSDREYNPPPELIISDHGLSSATGCDVVREVRAMPDYSQVPIILYSGGMSPAECEKAMQMGAAGCLSKPSDMSELSEQLREILQSHLPQHCQWSKQA